MLLLLLLVLLEGTCVTTFLTTNKVGTLESRFKSFLALLFFSLSFSLLKLSSKKNKKNKNDAS